MTGFRQAIVALLLAFLFVPTSGCLLTCDIHDRKFIWEQDDVPIQPTRGSVNYKLGDLWGGVGRSPDDNKLMLIVHGHDSVSHDEGVEFAQSLFASKGWPEPRLEGAFEEASCGDDY